VVLYADMKTEGSEKSQWMPVALPEGSFYFQKLYPIIKPY
jgi:hypothetical protein